MTSFAGNTNVIELSGLSAALDAHSPINDAVVTATIKDSDGATVTTLPMNYVAGSAGTYRAYLDASLPWVARATYQAIIDANGGQNRFGRFTFIFRPLARVVQDDAA